MPTASVLRLVCAVCRTGLIASGNLWFAMLDSVFSIHDGLDGVRVALSAISFMASLAYFVVLSKPMSYTRTAAKTVVFAVLAPLPLTYIGAVPAAALPLICLSGALALSAIGDMFLAIEDQRRYFVLGLSSFLLGHVAYIGAFMPFVSEPSLGAIILMALVAGSAAALMATLWSGLGSMRPPVAAYFSVIMTMVFAALCVPVDSVWLGTGAILFALSDSLIAVRKFLKPVAGINELVWLTYIAAQFLIIFSMLNFVVASPVL